MIEANVAAAASLLAAALRDRRPIVLPAELAPRDLIEGTAIQDAITSRLDRVRAGWKLGHTSAAAAAASGFDHPFTGELDTELVQQSPGRFAAGTFLQPLIEAEFAFRMGRDLPPRSEAYEEDEVLGAVQTAFIGIEIPDVRYAGSWPFPIPLLAADNGAAGGFVVGPDIPDWRHRDLTAIETTLDFNGSRVAGSLAGAARTKPVPVLVWCANELSRRGIGLRRGEIVTTGSACTPTACPPNTVAVGRFAGVGEVSVTIEG